jgi:putative oxidoreductase
MAARRFDVTALLIARVLIGGMFIWAGFSNLADLGAKVGYAASKGLPAPAFFVTGASLLLLAGGLSIAAGFRPRLGVAAVAIFLIGVTPVMHNFWALRGFEQELELHTFAGNVGLLGGAIAFAAIPRPWPMSVDRWIASLVARPARERLSSAA